MHKCLSPGAIGVRGMNLLDSIELARLSGFDSLAFDIREASTLIATHGVEFVREAFDDAGVMPGTWGLPVAWNGTPDVFQRDLAALPKLAEIARSLGCTGTSTWCPPASDDRDFEANLAWHVSRFRPIAEALRDAGCRLGIEFIGPPTGAM